MHALLRIGMLLVILMLAAWLTAAHGLRGLAVVLVVAVLTVVPRTRAWRMGERVLVRLTGSRRRAAALVMAVLVCGLIAVNLYDLVR